MEPIGEFRVNNLQDLPRLVEHPLNPQPSNASAGITPACLLSPVRHVLLARRSHQHGFVVQLHPDKLGFIRNHLAGPCLSFRVIAVARISAFGISHAAAAVSAN